MKKLFLFCLAILSCFCLYAVADTLNVVKDTLNVVPLIPAETKKEFAYVILGGLTPFDFCVYLFYALWGMLINLIMDYLKREKSSLNSPVAFSVKYWWKDNFIRILLNFITIPLFIIFSGVLLGTTINGFVAFSIGFGVDYLLEILKRKALIKSAEPTSNTKSEVTEK